MQKLRLLSLALVLTLGAVSSVPATGSTPAVNLKRANYSYQDGYKQGFDVILQNKCIDRNNFEANYYNYYLPQALRAYDDSIGSGYEEYYQGYLDGLQEGYYSPAFCG